MFVTSHPRIKTYRIPFIVLIMILITSACNSARSSQPFNSTFGENIQEPYNQATEEMVLNAYLEEVDVAWISIQSELEEEEEKVNHLLNTIDAITDSSELAEINNQDLSFLLEDLEVTKTKIHRIKNQYKFIAPLRSGQDFLDYTDELNNIFLTELEYLNNHIEKLMTAEGDLSDIDEEIELGLSGLSRNLFAFEQILFRDDVQDFMVPYIEYAEGMVTYISLLQEEIDQEIIFVAALIDVKEIASAQEDLDLQFWNELVTEGTSLLLLRDYMASENHPSYPVDERSSTPYFPIQTCGSYKITSPVFSNSGQTSLSQPVDITCPIMTDFDNKIVEMMHQKWEIHYKRWKVELLEGLRDLWKDYVQQTHESNRPLPLLEDEYESNRNIFIRKMNRDLDAAWSEIQNELQDMYRQENENLTKKTNLQITAAHQMFVAGYPNYTIQVNGSHLLKLNPWLGIFGIGKFPMEASWPMGYGAALFGGDTITTLFRGRCEDDIFYITVINDAGGSTASGVIVHPKGPTPLTVTRWVIATGYEMMFAFSGSGEAPPQTYSAAELYLDIAGTVSWKLDIDH